MALRKLKLITILAVMLLTAYPIVELTRCIVKYMLLGNMGTLPIEVYFAELSLMWGFYICVPWVISKVFNLVWLMGRYDESIGH